MGLLEGFDSSGDSHLPGGGSRPVLFGLRVHDLDALEYSTVALEGLIALEQGFLDGFRRIELHIGHSLAFVAFRVLDNSNVCNLTAALLGEEAPDVLLFGFEGQRVHEDSQILSAGFLEFLF